MTTPSYTLELCADNANIKTYYMDRANYTTDAGIDLFIINDIGIQLGETKLVDLGIKCRMLDNNGNTVSYYMYPRSSISNTPLMLANSVGIIDKDYRGNIKAAFKYCADVDGIQYIRHLLANTYNNPPYIGYTIRHNTRLVQITAPNLGPLALKLVDSLDDTKRGANGFGSTGI